MSSLCTLFFIPFIYQSKTNADFLLSLSPHMCGTTLRFFISGTITAEILEKGLALLLPQSL